jgi:hypothetical protein
MASLGPSMIHRLGSMVEQAEDAGTDSARLGAHEQLRQMIPWLRSPLVNDGEESDY